jgi:hypothetical protein
LDNLKTIPNPTGIGVHISKGTADSWGLISVGKNKDLSAFKPSRKEESKEMGHFFPFEPLRVPLIKPTLEGLGNYDEG